MKAIAAASITASAILLTAGCGSENDAPPVRSTHPSPAPPASPQPANQGSQPAPTAPGPIGKTPAGEAPAGQQRDDDPGGAPCSDQSGAPGTYIWSDDSDQWVCQISGDAPPQSTAPQQGEHDDDPGGHPCTDQSGEPGTYIWSDDTSQWVCQIS